MPTHLGSAAIDAAHLGASAVDRIYLGDSEVYAPGSAGDPDFASVSLLAHFDGSGNTYVDSSSNANTIADSAYNGGGDTQSTAQSKFGGSSLLVGSPYAAAVQASNCAPSGTGDFTIEMWGYASSSSPYSRDMIATSTVLTATTFELEDRRLAVNGSTVLSFTAPTNGAWFHLALVRESNVWRVYRDGIELANATNSTSLPTGQSLFIGGLPYYGSDGWLGSYIDEVRVTLGVVRYPGGTTFTPPTDAFPNS